MKEFYENAYKQKLPRRTNVLIRIDGKAFHTYTRGLQKPFDKDLMDDMAETTKYICENIQGAKFGYTQSDEISILVTDYDDNNTSAWFDNQVSKIISVSASLATSKFNSLRAKRGFIKLAEFDSRVFIIPYKKEVVNYFIWRQQDATRNSISGAAQANFSHTELQNKNASEMQDMLMLKKGINWNDYIPEYKRGTVVIPKTFDYKRDLLNTKAKPILVEKDEVKEVNNFVYFSRNKWVAESANILTQNTSQFGEFLAPIKTVKFVVKNKATGAYIGIFTSEKDIVKHCYENVIFEDMKLGNIPTDATYDIFEVTEFKYLD
jgi:tRNA(His) 5'-end guanylyltransferase